MRRTVKSALLVLGLVGALQCYGQTWPSDNKVLQDVYGNYDAAHSFVTWDASKEARPSPFVGHGFANTGDKMKVQVLERVEKDSKFYVVLSASPAGQDPPYECHSCVVAIGAAIYRADGEHWALQAASPAATYGGGFGQPPETISVQICGKDTACVVVEDGFGGQGYWNGKVTILVSFGHTVRAVWSHPNESNNDGAYDPKGIDGSSVHYRKSGAFKFLVDFNQPRPLFDIEVDEYNSSCHKGKCSNIAVQHFYVFDGDSYKVDLKSRQF